MDIYTVKDTDIVYETSVDFGTRQCSKEIHIVQYDSSQPIIAVELYKNSKKFVLPAGYEANVRLGKRDGTFVYKKALGTNSDGNVLYWAIDVQMTLLYGKVQPIIELLYDGAVVGSSAMPLVIDRNPVQSSDVESQAEYPAIMERLGKAALDSNVVHLTGSETITGAKTFNESITIKSDKTIKTNEIDNYNGNALVRFKSIEGKNVFGGVNYDAVLMGTSDRPYYSKSGSDFSGSELALMSDVDTKLDKHTEITDIHQAYVKSSSGENWMWDMSEYNKPNTIAFRTSDGQLKVNETPSENDDATSKKYVDDHVDTLSSSTTTSINSVKNSITALSGRVDALEERVEDLEWADVQLAVTTGVAPTYYPTYDKDAGQNGTVISIDWSHQSSSTASTTSYVMDFNVVLHTAKADAGAIVILDDDWTIDGSVYQTSVTDESKYDTEVGTEHTHAANVMYLESEYTLPFTDQFDAPEALLKVASGKTLPAGSYYIKWHCSDGTSNDIYLTFTLSSAVAAGHQLRLGADQYWGGAMIGNTIKEYSDGASTTAIQTSTAMAQGQTGTYLGTVWGNTIYGTDGAMNDYLEPETNGGVTHYINHGDRIKMGYNRWSQSGLRQYLNAEGFGWWKAMSPFDVAPSYQNYRGFMSGLDESLRKVIVPIRRYQRTNYISDIGAYDYTYDKVFLRVPYEYYTATENNGSKEGSCARWPYYKALLDKWNADNSTSLSQFALWTTYRVLKKYSVSSKTSAQYVWSSSAARNFGCIVWNVGTGGNVNSNSACNAAIACCPAFVISK